MRRARVMCYFMTNGKNPGPEEWTLTLTPTSGDPDPALPSCPPWAPGQRSLQERIAPQDCLSPPVTPRQEDG